MLENNKITLEEVISILKPLKLSGKDLNINECIIENNDVSRVFEFFDISEKLYGIQEWLELQGKIIIEKNHILIYGKKIHSIMNEEKLRIHNFCYKITKIQSFDKEKDSYIISFFRLRRKGPDNYEIIPRILIVKSVSNLLELLEKDKTVINLINDSKFQKLVTSDIKVVKESIKKYNVENNLKSISKLRRKLLLEIGKRDFDKNEYKVLYKVINN